MAKWYDEWLTPEERKSLQVGQKGIRARRRMQQDPQNTRGYPKSGDEYQRQAAANASVTSRPGTDTRQKKQKVSSLMQQLQSRRK